MSPQLRWNSTEDAAKARLQLNITTFENQTNIPPNPMSSTTSPHTTAGCLTLQFQDFVPWDNPDNVISFQVEDLVRRLKDVVFLPILFLTGGPANVINMAVFYKQGLKERINVCLFALSLADGLYLASNMLWFGEQLQLQFTTNEM